MIRIKNSDNGWYVRISEEKYSLTPNPAQARFFTAAEAENFIATNASENWQTEEVPQSNAPATNPPADGRPPRPPRTL